jgi:hypothetical protein
VSDKDVLARIEGCWQQKVYYTLGSQPFAKTPVRIPNNAYIKCFAESVSGERQESSHRPRPALRRSEEHPTYGRAASQRIAQVLGRRHQRHRQQAVLKQDIEDKQRKKAAERKDTGKEWQPRFFTGAVTPVGRPDLTPDGEEALKRLREDKYALEPNKEYAAF